MHNVNLKFNIIVVVLIPFLFPSCATAISQERRDYILSHPHGWIELSFNDYQIPNTPRKEEKEAIYKRPYQCGVTIKINEEPYFRDYVYPFGEEEPYSVKSGFRFPAPVGNISFKIIYSGCDVIEGEEGTLEQAIEIDVMENMVQKLKFDGNSIIIEEITPNKTITLEDIYKAVTSKNSKN
jgi:hypothetical protein